MTSVALEMPRRCTSVHCRATVPSENRSPHGSLVRVTTSTSDLSEVATVIGSEESRKRHEGRIRAGDMQPDVSLVETDNDLSNDIDGAYRTKYRRHVGPILDSVLTSDARSATLKLEALIRPRKRVNSGLALPRSAHQSAHPPRARTTALSWRLCPY
jgi:hypothetical protein